MTEREMNLYNSLKSTAQCLADLIDERDRFRECWKESSSKIQTLKHTIETLYQEISELKTSNKALNEAYYKIREERDQTRKAHNEAWSKGYETGYRKATEEAVDLVSEWVKEKKKK